MACSLWDNSSQSNTENAAEVGNPVNVVENRFTVLRKPEYQNDLLGAFLDTTSAYIWEDRFEVCGEKYSMVCSSSHAEKPFDLEVESPLASESYSLKTFYGGLWTIQNGFYDALGKLLPFSLHDEQNMSDTERLDALFQIWFGYSLFESSTENELHRKVRVTSVRQWGSMLPKPTDTWRGTTYQNVYNILFKDVAHLLSISYVYLQSQNIDEATREYLSIAANDHSEYGSESLNHLRSEYMELFSEVMFPIHRKIEQESAFESGFYLNPALSVGFWLRRHADGSAPALWNLMLGMLQDYDPDWVEHLRTQYRSTSDIFQSPKQMTTSNHIFDSSGRAYVWVNVQHRNQRIDLWVDGVNHGTQQMAVITPGIHTVILIDCESGSTEHTDNSLCSCQYATLDVKAEEVKEIQFLTETKQECKSDGTTASKPKE